MTKQILAAAAFFLSVSSIASANGLMSEEAIRAGVKNQTDPMSCTEIIQLFNAETVPEINKLVKNNSLKPLAERKLVPVLIDEIMIQMKAKCSWYEESLKTAIEKCEK